MSENTAQINVIPVKMEKRRPRQPLMSVKIFGHLENVGGIHGDVAGAEGSDEIVNNHVENADVAKSSKL